MIFTEEQTSAIRRFVQTAVRSADAGTMQNIVFSGSVNGTHLKAKGVLRVIRGSRAVQLEHVYSEGRVAQENISPEDIGSAVERLFGEPFRRVDLHDAAGTASLMMSKKGRVTAVVPGSLRAALDSAVQNSITAAMDTFGGNDRAKKHLLTGEEPFLQVLGISDKNGRVHDKRQAKFRQICRFSELVMEQMNHLPKNGTLQIADLCCGKSYLSFAVYHCLTVLAGRQVEMVCMDLKQSVMDFCADAAKKLG
ncbi:MAG: methyltransferase, partial [Clostridia bacterium]|nr:methyltransferase [Clostridia bacterium]